MLKSFKMLAGAFVLAALALPVVAQQSSTAREATQAAPKKAVLTPQYVIAYGKVLARFDKNGITKFNYENGRLISEVLPNSVIGTYQYDAGKFTGIAYNDGRYITVSYSANGTISGLTTNANARVKFNVKSKMTPMRGFLTIQKGISAIRSTIASNYCVGTDDDDSCTIVVEDTLPPGDIGGGGGGGGWVDEPYSGEGGIHPPPNETPAECKDNICDGAKRNMDTYCQIAARTPRSFKLCEARNMEFYSKCLRSCETGDWTWMETFNYIWE